MLLKTKGLPMQNNGIPWGPIIIAVVVVGGLAYTGYKLIPKIESDYEPKNETK